MKYHPEGLPASKEIQTPITLAEIEWQKQQLDNIDAALERGKRQLEAEMVMADPETIKFLTDVLTHITQKNHAPDKSSGADSL
jgi:hypothetical protein